MPKSPTHNAIVLRPPPGARFSIHLADVELQFARGQERAVYNFLRDWLELYVLPEVLTAENPPADPEVTRLKKQIEADMARRANPNLPGVTQSEQKLAAMGMQPVPPTNNVPQYNATPHPAPIPIPAGQVVYGPNGPMSATEIAQLADKPIPGVGYVGAVPPPKQDGENG